VFIKLKTEKKINKNYHFFNLKKIKMSELSVDNFYLIDQLVRYTSFDKSFCTGVGMQIYIKVASFTFYKYIDSYNVERYNSNVCTEKLIEYLEIKYPDNVWTLYFIGVLKDDNEKLQKAVQLNHPFAKLQYAKNLQESEESKEPEEPEEPEESEESEKSENMKTATRLYLELAEINFIPGLIYYIRTYINQDIAVQIKHNIKLKKVSDAEIKEFRLKTETDIDKCKKLINLQFHVDDKDEVKKDEIINDYDTKQELACTKSILRNYYNSLYEIYMYLNGIFENEYKSEMVEMLLLSNNISELFEEHEDETIKILKKYFKLQRAHKLLNDNYNRMVQVKQLNFNDILSRETGEYLGKD
jgi:hypothetical protein